MWRGGRHETGSRWHLLFLCLCWCVGVYVYVYIYIYSIYIYIYMYVVFWGRELVQKSTNPRRVSIFPWPLEVWGGHFVRANFFSGITFSRRAANSGLRKRLKSAMVVVEKTGNKSPFLGPNSDSPEISISRFCFICKSTHKVAVDKTGAIFFCDPHLRVFWCAQPKLTMDSGQCDTATVFPQRDQLYFPHSLQGFISFRS